MINEINKDNDVSLIVLLSLTLTILSLLSSIAYFIVKATNIVHMDKNKDNSHTLQIVNMKLN